MIDELTRLGLSADEQKYIIAAFGNIVVEVAALLRELANTGGKLPSRYRSFSYPIVHLLFAVLGAGPLAVLLNASSVISALYIGISAPLILDRAAAGLKFNGTPEQ